MGTDYSRVFDGFSRSVPGFDSKDPIGSLERYFGSVDSETQKFRDACASRGFVAVMYDGMTREQVLAVLSAPETMRVLARG
jgi:hypothetical protein